MLLQEPDKKTNHSETVAAEQRVLAKSWGKEKRLEVGGRCRKMSC